MAYVPGCRYDLFISYASENDRDGWVEQFANALGHELGDLLGRQFAPKESVFFDKRAIETAQSFPDRLSAAARDSAILVAILSPGYLESVWCNRERTEFFSKLPFGAEPADCLAPILIRPFDPAGLNKLYRDAQRLSFLSTDGQTPFAVGSTKWTAGVRILAGHLRKALQHLRRKCRPVFLGKVADTERAQNLRAWCHAELERRYFRTVPEALTALDDTENVRASLQQAGLAVHFLGGADAAAMEAIESSAEICPGTTILYQPFGANLSPDERFWLNDFERQPGRYHHLTGKNDQELFALIDEQITQFHDDSHAAPAKADLALICDEPDLINVRQLRDDVTSTSVLALELPDFLEARMRPMERLRKLRDYLNRCESLLFYHGAGERGRLDLIWQQAESNRPGARRNWFLAPPDLDNKRQDRPDALWTVDQVVRFAETVRGANP